MDNITDIQIAVSEIRSEMSEYNEDNGPFAATYKYLLKNIVHPKNLHPTLHSSTLFKFTENFRIASIAALQTYDEDSASIQ